MASLRLGEHSRARLESVQGLTLMHDLDFRASINGTLVNLCALAAAHHQPERAVRLASAAVTQSETVGRLLIPLSQSVLEEALAVARGAMGEEAYARAWIEGGTLSLEEVIAEALRVQIESVSSSEPGAAGSPARAGAGQSSMLSPILTPREVEVLRLIAAGRTSKEIAAELVISVSTVDRHTTHIYTKIGARRRADATAFAVAHGLLPSTTSVGFAPPG